MSRMASEGFVTRARFFSSRSGPSTQGRNQAEIQVTESAEFRQMPTTIQRESTELQRAFYESSSVSLHLRMRAPSADFAAARLVPNSAAVTNQSTLSIQGYSRWPDRYSLHFSGIIVSMRSRVLDGAEAGR